MNAVVSEKGQVTIPKALRAQLGIRQGTLLQFSTAGGKLIASKALEDDPFGKWTGRGRLPKGIKSVDDYLRVVRNAHGR